MGPDFQEAILQLQLLPDSRAVQGLQAYWTHDRMPQSLTTSDPKASHLRGIGVGHHEGWLGVGQPRQHRYVAPQQPGDGALAAGRLLHSFHSLVGAAVAAVRAQVAPHRYLVSGLHNDCGLSTVRISQEFALACLIKA